MIMTVQELRKLVTTTLTDEVLQMKLDAIESLIRDNTHNRFIKRPFVAVKADIESGEILSDTKVPFKAGDTVQISQGKNAEDIGVYVVKEVLDNYTFTVTGDIDDFTRVNISKVEYSASIKLGVAKMVDWDINNGSKVGIQSETISRHSVTYFNMDGDNSSMGYPKSILGFLEPYKKARF